MHRRSANPSDVLRVTYDTNVLDRKLERMRRASLAVTSSYRRRRSRFESVAAPRFLTKPVIASVPRRNPRPLDRDVSTESGEP